MGHDALVSGSICEIQRFCIQDGPGIRTSVFLAGCPLRCFWCHNPEGWSAAPGLMYFEQRCIGCLECARICPSGALSAHAGRLLVKREFCRQCGRCMHVCPGKALSLSSRMVTAQQVMDAVSRDRVFYRQTGGGVTFSGGEPFQQPAFLLELLMRCKDLEISAAVETSAVADPQSLLAAARLDAMFLIDWKAGDPLKYRQLTGTDGHAVRDNIRLLDNAGARYTLRMPLLAGFNDSPKDEEGTADFLSCLHHVLKIDLLPVYRHAGEKYKALGLEPPGFPVIPGFKDLAERWKRFLMEKCAIPLDRITVY